VAHMPTVAALEVGNPVAMLVLVKVDDFSIHGSGFRTGRLAAGSGAPHAEN
jgi:hypothetical protein